MQAASRTCRILDGLTLALALLGLSLCLWLLSHGKSAGEEPLAGCGGGDCSEVLSSRWSYLFHVPVALPGALAYVGLILSFLHRLRWLRMPAVGAILGAAIWFILVQAFLLGKFCPLCMTAHGVAFLLGVIGFIRSAVDGKRGEVWLSLAIWTGLGGAALAIAQTIGPKPATHRVDAVSSAEQAGEISVDAFPRLGPTTAQHVLVEYFDYNCPMCRKMGKYLEVLRERYPAQVAVSCRPVPMDETCHPDVPLGAHRAGGCEMARAAFAVWFARPDAFADFHRDLLENPSPERADSIGAALLGSSTWAAAKSDSRIDPALRSNFADWKKLSTRSNVLPKLVIRNQRLVQGVPSSEGEFLRVIEGELGLAAGAN